MRGHFKSHVQAPLITSSKYLEPLLLVFVPWQSLWLRVEYVGSALGNQARIKAFVSPGRGKGILGSQLLGLEETQTWGPCRCPLPLDSLPHGEVTVR